MVSRCMLMLFLVSACGSSSNEDDSSDDCTSARSDQDAGRADGGSEVDAFSCGGTWDISTLGDAEAIRERGDRICVQAVDQNGAPTIYAVIEDAAHCMCPEPYLSEARQ